MMAMLIFCKYSRVYAEFMYAFLGDDAKLMMCSALHYAAVSDARFFFAL